MDISGTRTLAASRQAVWDALHNQAVLQSAIPGAEQVTWQGDSALIIQASVGLGPLKVQGSGQAQVVEQTPPSHMKLALNKRGVSNSIQAEVTVDLADAGAGTQVSYRAVAKLEGPIAMADNPVTRPVVDGMLGHFFSKLEQNIR
jgi:carbon monoxide dehydrogenase subunit G